MITSVIFDMDGLLFDTEMIYYACYKKAAAGLGLDFTFELFSSCVGISREEAAHFMTNHFGPDINPDDIDRRTFRLVDQYLENGGEIPLRPGAKEAVAYFHGRGLKVGMASSNLRKWVDIYLQKNEMTHYFSAITTADEVVRLKPNPEVYLKTADKLGSAVGECLVFEDSVAGATAGINAGMRTCMVPQIKQPDSFIKQNAFKIYPSLEDIYTDMDELLG